MGCSKDDEQIADNVSEIRRNMERAARIAGRRPDEVLLCAACKTHTLETIRASAALPVDLFGENRAQELVGHFDSGAYLGKPCHFIGHLQTNKVKNVVGRAAVIQSVDSRRLLDAIQKEAEKQGLVQEILFEINILDEKSKTGIAPEALWPLLEAAAGMDSVRVRGLMAIPPAFDNGPESRRYFAMLRRMMEKARERRYENNQMDTLSMGMTDSFQAAILEGATIVRVGRGIYGQREKL